MATSSCLVTTLLFDKIITLSLLLIDLLEISGFTVSQNSLPFPDVVLHLFWRHFVLLFLRIFVTRFL